MKVYTPKDKLLGLFCVEFGDIYEKPYYFNIHFLIRRKYWFEFGFNAVTYDCVNYCFWSLGPLLTICWTSYETD